MLQLLKTNRRNIQQPYAIKNLQSHTIYSVVKGKHNSLCLDNNNNSNGKKRVNKTTFQITEVIPVFLTMSREVIQNLEAVSFDSLAI